MAGTGTVLAIIDVCVGGWVTICGFISFVLCFFHFNVGGLFGSLFTILFGVMIVLYNLFHLEIIVEYFGYFQHWFPYGAFITFCGFSCWGSNHIVTFIFGLIIIVIGIVYMCLHFSPLERPGPLIGSSGSSGSSADQKSEGSDNQKQEQGQAQQQDQQQAEQPKESPEDEPTTSTA